MAIELVPAGEIEEGLLAMLRQELSRILRQDVCLGISIPVPSETYNSQRRQYAAEPIVMQVERSRPKEGLYRTLVVADVDLYAGDLRFVFGLAYRTAAIFSIYRLRPPFYGMPEDRPLFFRRVLTEAVHELGHTYGLPHSRDPRSVMFFSNSIDDTDRKGSEFSEADRQLLVRQGVFR